MNRAAITVLVGIVATVGSGTMAQEGTADARRDLSQPPFHFAQMPTLKAMDGPPNTLILDEPFAYSWTGHVSADVYHRAMFGVAKFKTPALAQGQAVYGLPMGYGGGGGTLFWCAPLKRTNGWWATCMRPGEKVTYSAYRGGLVVQQFAANTAQGSEPISVNAEPAPELAQGLRIKHYVGKWHKTYLELSTIMFLDQQQDGDGFWSNVPRGADGSVRVAIGGGTVKFVKRADGGFTASVEKPFTTGGSALVALATP